MTVVAEGVETAEQHERARSARVRLLPGLLLRPAMPADDLEVLLHESIDGEGTRLPLQVPAARSLPSLP